ncbi:hypothetical protein [Pedobacter nutrimenti]|uniref:hypothetical protein n=1 Tax=Pedobacter nutrimenti TaxID=1241337 RepID=UPI002930C21D|nr:hypothetical protein [Pedobacter nutrimenti]
MIIYGSTGDVNSHEHFVLKGIVKSAYTDPESREHILQLPDERRLDWAKKQSN